MSNKCMDTYWYFYETQIESKINMKDIVKFSFQVDRNTIRRGPIDPDEKED